MTVNDDENKKKKKQYLSKINADQIWSHFVGSKFTRLLKEDFDDIESCFSLGRLDNVS